jgi:hypothetical protein
MRGRWKRGKAGGFNNREGSPSTRGNPGVVQGVTVSPIRFGQSLPYISYILEYDLTCAVE